MIKLIFKLFLLFFITSYLINFSLKSDIYKSEVKDNFDGKKFLNIKNVEEMEKGQKERISFWEFFKEKRKSPKWTMQNLPSGEAKPKERVNGKEIEVTFINHATVLIQTEGLNILTDPIWSKRASPFSFIGPQRYMPVGISFDNLPEIDIILLSHNHYDHMDIKTLRMLYERDNPKIYTHLGNSGYLEKRGIKEVIDMDWWQEEKYSEHIQIHSVPAQHFSARALSDRNRTLWGGFVVSTNNGDIYFAGDTGYGPFVNDIKEKYPNGFRFAMIPIGAYEPRSFMKEMHTSPDDAILMHKELNIKNSLGIHHGTFSLSLESQFEPQKRIKELLEMEENKDVIFHAILNGESVLVN